MFSHGVVGHPDKFSQLLSAWARAGYVVAAPAFPLTNDHVPGSAQNLGLAGSQPADVSFVLDQMLALSADPDSRLHDRIDADQIGAGGLSLGGATTYAVAFSPCCRDNRIKAVEVLSGALLPVVGEFDLDGHVPLLIAHGDQDPLLRYANTQAIFGQAAPPVWFVTLIGASHATEFERRHPLRRHRRADHDRFLGSHDRRRPQRLRGSRANTQRSPARAPCKPSSGATDSVSMTPRRVERTVAVAAVALALLPLVLAIIQWIGRDWLPIHDVAVTDMRVRDVFTADTPLVGPYSRYLWNHPGPALFWLMAVPAWLSGHAAWGTLVAGVLVQAAAVLWAGMLAWRTGRLPTLLVTMAVILLTYRAIGPLVILEPWNPHIALPWFVLLVLYAWRLAVGEVRRLAGAFFVASFLVQTHIGYLPLVGAAAATVVAYRIVDHRRGRTEPVGRRAWIVSAVIAVVMWTPVLVEQFVHHPGNLSRLWDYFAGGQNTETPAGVRAAVGLFGSMFALPPSWLGGQETHDYLTDAIQPGRLLLIAIPIALLVVGLLGARAAGRREHFRFAVVVTALFAGGLVALSRVTGDLLAYLFYWRIPLALCVLVAGVVGVIDFATTPRKASANVARAGVAIGITVVLVASITTTAAVATHGTYVKPYEQNVQLIMDQIESEQIEPGLLDGQTILVRFDGSTIGGLQGGIVDALDREGVRVRVDDALAFQFGEHRAATTDEVDQVWYAIEEGLVTSIRTSDPRGRVIARTEPLGPEAEAEMVQLQLELRDQLGAAGRLDRQRALDSELVAFALQDVPGIDHAAVARLGDLNRQLKETEQCRCSVVAFDPGVTLPNADG